MTASHNASGAGVLAWRQPEQIALLRAITAVTDDGCWVGNSKRYGTITRSGRSVLRHRFAWEAAYSAIPPGMYVCHRCNNKPCCNPEHLYLGTAADNGRDAWRDGLNPGNGGRAYGPTAENARKTHCKRGHPLAGENLYVNKRGYRTCRICQREGDRRYRMKVKHG